MTWQSDKIIEKSKEHLIALREITGLIMISRQMIVRSYTSLGLMDKTDTDAPTI